MGKLYINWTLGILQEIQMEIEINDHYCLIEEFGKQNNG